MTTRSSTATSGVQATGAGPDGGHALRLAVSADGRFVAFVSDATNLVPNDTNLFPDVFVKDRATDTTTRVSVSSSGAQADGSSYHPGYPSIAISADGRYVVFASLATNLVTGDTNGVRDVFRHDRQTGQTIRVSLSAKGVAGDRESAFPSISADGRYVSFTSGSTNLFPGVTNGVRQVYRKDLVDGSLDLVSQETPIAGAGPLPGNSTSGRTAISADGRYVAFESAATNLAGVRVADTADWDIFVHDTAGSTRTVRVSVRSDGTKTAVVNNFGAWQPAISGDGRFVAFGQDETGLVPEDTNGLRDIYVHDRDADRDGIFDEPGSVTTFRASPGVKAQSDGDSFVEQGSLSFDGRYLTFNSLATTLTPENDPVGVDTFVVDLNGDGDKAVGEPGDIVTTRVSISTQGVKQSGSSVEPAISADGRFIVFNSFASGLVSNDTNGVADTFVHDLFALAVSSAGSGTESALNGDGRFLAFESADPLVPGDTNGVSDVFVRDRARNSVVRLSLSSLNVQGNGGSFRPAISRDGRFVAFESDAANLIADDTNGVRDVFLRDRDADGNGVFDEPGGSTTTLVSRSVGGAAGRGASVGASISADGVLIAFSSAAPNLIFADTNGLADIFVRDRTKPNASALTRVNLGPGGAQSSGGDSTSPAISGNGRYVAFASAATNLVDSSSEGGADSNGVVDVFRHDRSAGTTARVNLTGTHAQSGGGASEPAINGNGDLVAFVTAASLLPADTNTVADVYIRTVSSHVTSLESVSGTGANANGASSEPALSESGRMLLFTSLASNLSLLDTNGVSDVYVRDRFTGVVRVASVVGTRMFTTASRAGAVSLDGRTVAYSTVDPPAGLRGNALTMATETGVSITTQQEPASLDITVSLSPASAPVNQTQAVQISGTGLSGVSAVYFGAAPGSGLQLVNDGLLFVTAPASATAGSVHVQLSYGSGVGSVLRPNAFEYLAAGDPTPVCDVTLNASATSIQQSGGPVSLTVTAPASCSWRAENTVDWIAVSEPAASAGTNSVQVTVQPNDNPAERSGKVVVARKEVELTQQGTGCGVFSVLPHTHRVDIDAVEVSDDHITINIGPGCDWSATSSDTSWLQVNGGSGPATVFFTTSVNTSPFDRSADIAIVPVGGNPPVTVRVTQAGAPPPETCVYTVTAPGPIPVQGGVTQVAVATPAGLTCPWNASTAESWIDFPSGATGTNSGMLSVRALTANGGGNRQAQIDVAGHSITILQDGAAGGQPFGVVDLPASVPNVTGSYPLTGWALDDVAVTGVEIFRLSVPGETAVNAAGQTYNVPEGTEIFIGTASFVLGARPDVEQIYAGIPNNARAGWGYLLLSNQLPELGAGDVTLIFRAWDGPGQWQLSPLSFDGCTAPLASCPTRGNVFELGRTVLRLNNRAATAPFGSIDLPGQGQQISGTIYRQWGWVLTPPPKTMAREGIHVIIDGVDRGALTAYGLPRPDVQAFFPSTNNSAGAGGYLDFDTTMLNDGVHTIAWVATDDAGAASGIGSRYFSVSNNSSLTGAITSALRQTSRSAADLASLPAAADQLQYTRGLKGTPANARGDGAGVRHVTLRALDILRLPLASHGAALEGYRVNAGELQDLPIGSTLADGVFSWQLGPGFAGIYDLLFVRRAGDRSERIPIRVVVEPFGGEAKQRLVVDAPRAGGDHTAPFTLGGWGMSGGAAALSEVAVYAYPVDGGDPFFVGTAALGGARADVAAAFGGQFARSGFSLKVEFLPPGVYDFLVAARSDVSSALDTAVWVRSVTIR